MTDEKKVLKKRGRKPKNYQKPPEENEPEVKVLKKRGRKPKDKTYNINNVLDNVPNISEKLIINLKLEVIENNDEISYDPLENLNETFETSILQPLSLNDNNVDSSLSFSCIDNKLKINPYNNTRVEYDYETNNTKVYKILGEFSKETWPEKTNLCCWWCCNQFKTVPTGIPCSYNKNTNKFKIYGCMCSFECACSYIFNDSNDNKSWDKYTLLIMLYNKIFNCGIRKIKLAPPRETLQMFGGNLTIDEFRNNNKVINIKIPPIISSIIPQIEEITFNPTFNSIIPVNNNKINNANNNLKLKRKTATVKQKTHRTLEECMGLKTI